jgi:hypothetical protein
MTAKTMSSLPPVETVLPRGNTLHDHNLNTGGSAGHAFL